MLPRDDPANGRLQGNRRFTFMNGSRESILLPGGASNPGNCSHSSGSNPDVARGAILPEGAVLAGRFRVEGILGNGALTRVYRALDSLTGQSMAIKIPVEAGASAESITHILRRELRLYRRVKANEHVLRVYDLHKEGGMEFLSMEYADGGTLRAWLDENRNYLASRRAQAEELLRAICLGLTALEDAGIVMVGLKPECLLFVEGTLKISDLGSCFCPAEQDTELFPDSGAPSRRRTTADGSPGQEYASERGSYTPGMAIYSLGCILHQVLSSDGRGMPDGNTRQGVRAFNPSVLEGSGEGLVRIVTRCLATNPRNRYTSAHEPLAELENAACNPCHATARTRRHSREYDRANLMSLSGGVDSSSSSSSQRAAKPSAICETPLRSTAILRVADKDLEPLRREVAEDMGNMDLQELHNLLRRVQLFAPAHPLIEAVRSQIEELRGSYDDLTREAWQSIQRGDWVYAKRQLEAALRIDPSSLAVTRALEVVDCLLNKMEKLIKNVGDRDGQVMVSLERMADYIGVLLGFQEGFPWTR